jgi:hypothetical protein
LSRAIVAFAVQFDQDFPWLGGIDYAKGDWVWKN